MKKTRIKREIPKNDHKARKLPEKKPENLGSNKLVPKKLISYNPFPKHL